MPKIKLEEYYRESYKEYIKAIQDKDNQFTNRVTLRDDLKPNKEKGKSESR